MRIRQLIDTLSPNIWIMTTHDNALCPHARTLSRSGSHTLTSRVRWPCIVSAIIQEVRFWCQKVAYGVTEIMETYTWSFNCVLLLVVLKQKTILEIYPYNIQDMFCQRFHPRRTSLVICCYLVIIHMYLNVKVTCALKS